MSVNTYNTVSPVAEVSYTLAANDKIIGKGKLTKNTDWNFSTELDVTTRNNNKALSVTVKVVFGNGENAESTSVFECTNKALVINASGTWTDLLGNPSHRGFTADTLKTPLQPVWVANAGSNLYMASPLIANGMVYVATVDENYTGKAGICAFDVVTGKEVWKFKTRNSVKNSITAANGKVFAQDTEGYLYAVDGKSGSKVWEKKMNVAWLPAVVEGITSANGIVYAGTGTGLCAVNANTGETLWENTAWGQREGATTTITYSDNRIFSGAQWGGVYANDATTGKMLWSNGKDGLSDRGSSAAAINGALYLISRSSLFVLDATTGKTIIRKNLPFKVDVTSTPLVTDDRIIFGSQSGLISLVTNTLETEWTFDTGEAVVYTGPYTRKGSRTVETSPILSGNTVFFGASDGNFYAVSATDGKLQWKHATGAPIFSSPACSGNVLVFTDYGGNIYAFASDL